MAQLTNSTATAVRPYRVRGGGSPPIWHFQESTVVGAASSNRVKWGDVVQFDVNVATANHRLVKASTMANVPNILSTAFAGIAANTPASTASDTVPGPVGGLQVYLASPQVEFLWPSKATGAQHASSLVGQRRAIAYDSTDNIYYCDVANSTAGDASLLITELIDAGTTNGLIVAKFLSTAVARFVSVAY